MSWGVDNTTNRLLYKYLIQLEQMRASRAAACIKHNLDNVNTAQLYLGQADKLLNFKLEFEQGTAWVNILTYYWAVSRDK